ncbi:KH domain-containing protein [Desulfopila inferna]|uniref:KH domain-containing protein n=1 Tax=Desulfopila inferna TaxID=468528 RepID=UPI001966CD74|nr:KH domain-containing protein [Desulfopila inferna]MBM9604307.1 KH domain-containing protein [Desulfopila inferna]
MQDLVVYIAKALVDNPDEVKTTVSEEEDSITIGLSVAQEDLGKVIGKQGRTARAMRTLLAAAADKENKKTRLDILE